MKRYAIVFSCLVALFGVQLTRPTSSQAGAESPRALSVARNASLTNTTYKWLKNVKPEDVVPLVPEVTTCIAGTLSATSAKFNRPNTAATGTGFVASPCPSTAAGADMVPYNIYQFSLTGCTNPTNQVTISVCGGNVPGSGCATGSAVDTIIFIYRSGASLTAGTGATNSFNPTSPCTNLVAANDNLSSTPTSAGGSSCDQNNTSDCHALCTVSTSLSGLKRTFGPGVFTVVVAGGANTVTGSYNLSVSTTGAGCVLNAPTAVKLESFNATNYDGVVSLDWKTGHELDNLGFNVYRDERGRRTLVTPQMVAGSALLAGPGTTLGAGQSYSWLDSQPHSKKARYWLEEIDLNGQSTWHGPVSAADSGNKNISPPRRGRDTLLSALGAGGAQASSSPVEMKAALAEPSQVKLQAQASLASQKAVKLSVKQEGFYRVYQPDLVRAGLDPNVNPRLLQLYVGGQQVPIAEVNTANGRFDPSSAIEFYGLGIDSAVTDSQVYWLVAGSEPGLRIGLVRDRSIPGKSSGESFPYTVERKDRTIYFSSLRNGEKENFFGPVVARNPVDQALSLQNLDAAASEAFLEVALQGVSQLPHRVQAQINGARAGDISFSGQTGNVARFSIPQALLKQGQNIVTIVPQGDQSDVSLIDYVRITYQHTLTADGDVLKFTASPQQMVTVKGFSNPAVRLFDITDPNNVLEIEGKVKQDKTSYAITAATPGQSQRTLLALANGRAKNPSSIVASRGVNLRQEGPGADFFIITRRDFFDGLKPLVTLRQNQGLSVSVVDIEDIYDSFSFGQKTPQAIRDFFAYAKASYKTPPRYALIAADASFDPKNYLGFGNKDIVPTKLIDTQLMETASDDWFVESGGGPESVAIGRLPIGTAQEAASLAAKIVGYDQALPSQEMLLVSDSNDLYDFEAASASLRALIPSTLTVEEIDRGQDGDALAKSRLLNALTRGQKLVNYIGHGSIDQWKANLLTAADINALPNESSLPVFVMMTCLNGYFQDVSLDSLAESLVKAPKGAIAVWASSGMTSPDVQSPANQELYRLLFNKNNSSITLGDAIRGAKAAASSQDVRRTWILFGDPAMTIR